MPMTKQAAKLHNFMEQKNKIIFLYLSTGYKMFTEFLKKINAKIEKKILTD